MRTGLHFIHQKPGENSRYYWEVPTLSLQSFIQNDMDDPEKLQEIANDIAPIMHDANYDGIPWNRTYQPARSSLPRVNDPTVTYLSEPQTATTSE